MHPCVFKYIQINTQKTMHTYQVTHKHPHKKNTYTNIYTHTDRNRNKHT